MLTVRSEIVYSDKPNLDFWIPKKRPRSTKPARERAG
jgi:hypothetical protein